MKKIINGRKYDTSTAKWIAKDWSDFPKTDFSYWEESLFRKKNGEFFLYGWGGAMSKYSKQIGQNEWMGSEKITPVSIEEAKTWGEEHMTTEAYEATFGAVKDQPIETFYTGGGIWLTVKPTSEWFYYLVDADSNCLSYFSDRWKDGEEYPCQRMEWSRGEEELNQRQKVIYHEMKAELFRKAW